MSASLSKLRTLVMSTIGLKVAMAASGAGLAAFVLFHMLGNLTVFAGQDTYNAYAAFLQGQGGLLWVARLGLLGLLVVHVACAINLSARNRAARPTAYAELRTQTTSWNAKLMLHTGIVIAAFIAYHLAHLTLGVVHPEHFDAVDAQGRHDVYLNFVESFKNPVIAITYVVANVAVASHLAHATSSMFRTLGLSVGGWRRPMSYVGPAFGTVIGIGNLSMPLAGLLGAL